MIGQKLERVTMSLNPPMIFFRIFECNFSFVRVPSSILVLHIFLVLWLHYVIFTASLNLVIDLEYQQSCSMCNENSKLVPVTSCLWTCLDHSWTYPYFFLSILKTRLGAGDAPLDILAQLPKSNPEEAVSYSSKSKIDRCMGGSKPPTCWQQWVQGWAVWCMLL